MTAPDLIPATTDQGSGLLLPAMKAYSHIMTVYNAISREWPMATTDAMAELGDAADHLRTIKLPVGLMTQPTEDAVVNWIAEITGQIEGLEPPENDEAPLAEAISADDLKRMATQSWQLATQLDRELTGLNPNDTDPGQLP